MMTRWHEDDLVGRLKKRGREDLGVDVESIVLPAIAYDDGADVLGRVAGDPLWPERWPLAALEQRRSLLSAYWWASLYQQKPGQYGKSEWPDTYFEDPFWCDEHEWPDAFEASCIFIDPSKGTKRGDFAGIVFVGLARGKLWVDSVVERLPVEEIALSAYDLFETYGADRVGIESNAFQFLLERVFDDLVEHDNRMPLPLSLVHNSQSKTQLRIPRLGPYLRKHQFRFLRSVGNQRLVAQLKAFPYGDHDDGPDSLESALRVLRHVLSQDEDDDAQP
jgi:predicted phage terminase large subunit-like protein